MAAIGGSWYLPMMPGGKDTRLGASLHICQDECDEVVRTVVFWEWLQRRAGEWGRYAAVRKGVR